ncbi:MAG: outer membrane protein assembly factor BamA [Halofilum sp. (in: g-proteobacteria)]
MRLSMTGALAALVLTFAPLTPAHAWEPFVVEEIEIRSAERIEDGTILNYLPVRTGERFGPEDTGRAIRALYETGLFEDVSLSRDGDVLVVDVKERPAIGEINIEGDYSMEEEQLRESLADIGLAPGRIFERAMLDRTEQEIRRLLYSQGKYGMEMSTDVRDLDRNRVGIDVNLREGRVARIRQISILGNEEFGDETLKDQMESGIPGPLSFFSSADEYSRSKLEGDLEEIRSYYMDRGFIRFSVTSSQVTITPDKKDIYVTINVDEGKKYSIRDVSVSGDLPVDEEELLEQIELEKGDLFSRKSLTASRTAISDRLAQAGYAFANVNVSPEIDEEEQEVDLEFYVEPGSRVYVRRVSFSGHTTTEDEVFRRELRQMEGGLYSPSDLDRSRVRLQRLDPVERVEMDTEPVPGESDKVDVNYDIKERQTGSLRLGAGYSTGTGLGLNVGVSERNLLGTGQDLDVNIDTTEINRTFELRYTDPYYTDWGVSRTLRFVYTESDPNDILDTTDYFSDSADIGFRFGVPMSEYDTLRYGLGFDGTRIRTTDSTPQPIEDFIDERGNEFVGLKGMLSYSRDSRNRTVFADHGTLQTLSLDFALPESDYEYYKLGYQFENYLPLTDSLVLSTSARVGYGAGYGEEESLPFYRRYFAGGIRSVRGFSGNSLGPRYTVDEAEDEDPKGGDFVTTGSLELVFPPPFVEETGQTRLSTFVDFGNVFEDARDFESSDLRASAGVAFNWRSPVGPLSISVAEPLVDEPGDDTERFQFTIGTLF